MSAVKRIILEREDGTVNEVKKGLVVEMVDDEGGFAIDMHDVRPIDICMMTIAMTEAVQQMGYMEELKALLSVTEVQAEEKKEYEEPVIEEITGREGNAYEGTDRELLEGNMQNEEVGEDKSIGDGEDRNRVEGI